MLYKKNKYTDAVTNELQESFKKFKVKSKYREENEYEEVPLTTRHRPEVREPKLSSRSRKSPTIQPHVPYVSHGPNVCQSGEYEEYDYRREDKSLLDGLDKTLTNGLIYIYNEGHRYYKYNPEHKWLHFVILLWTILLLTILT